MKTDKSGLLIAALVAIVAIVGLVILFNGNATGAYSLCPDGFTAQSVSNVGGQTGYISCVPDSTGLIYPQAQRPLVGGANSYYYHYWRE